MLKFASYGTVVVTSEEEIQENINITLTRPGLVSPCCGLVEGGQQEFTFLRVADQSGSLLGLQGWFSEGGNRTVSTPVLLTANLGLMGFASARIEMCNVGPN